MDIAFSEEQVMLQQTVRQFALNELLPNYHRWDRGEKLPREKVIELGALGVLGLRIPEEYGGQPSPFTTIGIVTEELARGDFSYTLFIQLGLLLGEVLRDFGHEEVKQEWLPKLATGEAIPAFALTEPAVGSDAANITTRAVRDGDDYLISGEKSSITFAGMADICLLFARTGDAGARGISAFAVPLDLPGVGREVYRSPGERLTQRGSLYLDDVRVPARYRLGDENKGFYQAMAGFDYNRAIIALACIGTAQQSIDETVEYTKQREAFGRPIARHEGVSFQIAEYTTLLQASRLLAYQCLDLKDRGLPHTKEAAMSKWLGPKVSAEAVHACLILHGHYGYNQDTHFDQRWRDIVGLEIGDGTPEVMKGIIAREIYGREFQPYR
ncbi:MAG TPA: acyl-CoA dehydrogenase family protein [Dehalococcoidia bacterium]|nr:acyl-CoA dehydrogenase family protein [Dehalococcoidia bacterium]